MSDNEYYYLLKVILLGDSGVGKTSLRDRFIWDEFDDDIKPTFGMGFSTKLIQAGARTIRAQIWDIDGQGRYPAIKSTYYRGASGALLAYDVNNHQTFKNVAKWLEELRQHAAPNIVTMLVGNKEHSTKLCR